MRLGEQKQGKSEMIKYRACCKDRNARPGGNRKRLNQDCASLGIAICYDRYLKTLSTARNKSRLISNLSTSSDLGATSSDTLFSRFCENLPSRWTPTARIIESVRVTFTLKVSGAWRTISNYSFISRQLHQYTIVVHDHAIHGYTGESTHIYAYKSPARYHPAG